MQRARTGVCLPPAASSHHLLRQQGNLAGHLGLIPSDPCCVVWQQTLPHTAPPILPGSWPFSPPTFGHTNGLTESTGLSIPTSHRSDHPYSPS